MGIGGSILIWFPPAGVAIAAVTLVGVRMLPAVLVAELLSTVLDASLREAIRRSGADFAVISGGMGLNPSLIPSHRAAARFI